MTVRKGSHLRSQLRISWRVIAEWRFLWFGRGYGRVRNSPHLRSRRVNEETCQRRTALRRAERVDCWKVVCWKVDCWKVVCWTFAPLRSGSGEFWQICACRWWGDILGAVDRDERSIVSRVGLVLGAGGATGLAFHVGTLLALQTDTGWDPASADAIVGTSAGSIVGTLIRSGATVDDLSAWGSQVDPLPHRRSVRTMLDEAAGTSHRLSMPSWLRPEDFVRPLRSALSNRAPLTAVALSALTFGVVDARASLRRFAGPAAEWPAKDLSIVAVRAGSGSRKVFDSDDGVELGLAVAASCAVPLVYRPVRIGGRIYVDGAVHSPTNADVLVGAGVDTAVVLSPMSGPDRVGGLQRHARRHFSSLLERECDQLNAHGIDVIVFEPDLDTIEAMGLNALNRDRAPDVLTKAFFGVAPEQRERLRAATTRRTKASL